MLAEQAELLCEAKGIIDIIWCNYKVKPMQHY